MASRLPRALIFCAGVGAVLLAVEGLSRIAYRVARGRWFSSDEFRSVLLERVASSDKAAVEQPERAGARRPVRRRHQRRRVQPGGPAARRERP